MPARKIYAALTVAAVAASTLTGAGTATAHQKSDRQLAFDRTATYPVFQNRPAGEDPATPTVAEISAVSEDGRTLIYTDALARRIGFLDLSNPDKPRGLGTLSLAELGDAEDEPTSVAVVGQYVLVVVNTSPSFTAPSGRLDVISLSTRQRVASFDLGGQPDSIAISKDKRYAAIAIENERDEEVAPPGGEDGDLPQAPAGFLQIVDLTGENPSGWKTRPVRVHRRRRAGAARARRRRDRRADRPGAGVRLDQQRQPGRGHPAGEQRGCPRGPADRPDHQVFSAGTASVERHRHGRGRHDRPDRLDHRRAARARRAGLDRRPLPGHRERGRLAGRHPGLDRLRQPYRQGRLGRGQQLRAARRHATGCTTRTGPRTRAPSRRASRSPSTTASATPSSARSGATSSPSTTSAGRPARSSSRCCRPPTAPRGCCRSRRATCSRSPARRTTPRSAYGPR